MYVIKTKTCTYVAQFDVMHQCVTMCATQDIAMCFRTESAAWSFIEGYADAGYGLSSKGLRVVKASN